MYKRWLSLALWLVMLSSLFGCTPESGPSSSPNIPTASTTTTAIPTTTRPGPPEVYTVEPVDGAFNDGFHHQQDSWVRGDKLVKYYMDYDWESPVSDRQDKLYQTDADGNNKKLLAQGMLEEVYATEDGVYYSEFISGYNTNTNHADCIQKITLDGRKKTILRIEAGDYGLGFVFRIYKGHIYFYHRGENFTLYRADLDGKHIVKIFEQITDDYCGAPTFGIADDWIYNMYPKPGGQYLHRIKLDGSEVEPVDNLYDFGLNVAGDYMYYIADDQVLYKKPLKGGDRIMLNDQLFKDDGLTGIVIVDGYGYAYGYKIWLDGSGYYEWAENYLGHK